MFAFRKQPFKTIYIVYTLLAVSVKLPYWTLISLFPSWRPHPNWTLTRSITLPLLRSLINIVYATGLFVSEDAEKSARSANKLGFVWVEPLPKGLLKGEVATMAAVNEVESTRTHGYWYGKGVGSGSHGGKAQPDEKVLYHLHGGGYIMGSASPASVMGPTTADYVKHCFGLLGLERAFCLNYRLASAAPLKAENPFPAQLIDALAGYRYLVETLGFNPTNIIVSGDSAGGHLALSLVRYLTQETTPVLPPPGALVLLSPTGDWGHQHDAHPESSWVRHAHFNAGQQIFESGYTARALCGALPADSVRTNSWISPTSARVDTHGLFVDFPPTFVLAGGIEQMLDDIKILCEQLQNDNDNGRITYVEYPEASHDFIMIPCQEPDKTLGAKEVARWLASVYDGSS